MITIDGYEWPVPCDIERTAEVTPSEISGMMLDRTYFNDVLGTYMRYSVSLAVPPTMESDYSALYETLTDPVDAHTFVLPHNQSEIEVTGRVDSVQDTLVYTVSHKQYWKGIKFDITANHPSKRMSLGEVLSIGRSPMPEAIGVPIGAIYERVESGWERLELTDADEVHF